MVYRRSALAWPPSSAILLAESRAALSLRLRSHSNVVYDTEILPGNRRIRCYTSRPWLERTPQLQPMKLTRYREFTSISPQPGVRLCALESDRYKTARARVFLLSPLLASTATITSLLASCMRAGSENHSTRRDLARATEELYGASLGVSVSRVGDLQALTASIEFPADRFLPKGSHEMQRSLALMGEVLLRPALNPGRSALRADVVDQERFTLGHELNALQDDKPSWAAIQATRMIYAGTPGAVYEHGAAEELPAVTPEQLLQRHRYLVANARVYGFITGPVGMQDALIALHRALPLPSTRRAKLASHAVLKSRQSVQRRRMTATTEQTHLVFAWSGGPLYGTPAFAASLFADTLFGGYSMSRLFKVVREEHGLAYSVHSSYQRARGVLMAQAAVDNAKADQAVKLIRSEFKRLVHKGFSQAEFDAVRESLVEGRKSAMDSMSARVSDLLVQSTMGFKQSFEQQIKEIRKVTPGQVQAVLKRLKPHSEFRLG